MRLSILILTAAATVLAACGGTNPARATAAHPSPTASARGNLGNAVGGKLTQLNGSQLVLSAQSGDVNVTTDSSTRVQRTSAGSLAEAVPGTCVSVTGQKDPSGAVAATSLTLMPGMNGVCTQQAGGGQGAGAGGGQGAGAGGQGRGAGRPSAPANLAFVRGKITAAQGPALTVLDVSGAPTAVNVSGSTRITRTDAATTGQLAVGQCIVANGQRDSTGTVTARQLSIVESGPNGCPTGRQGGAATGA